MSLETAEWLKRELTDKYVVVKEGVPELRRFQGLTGTVKTVNMSGRALVQFDGPADIGWYDIDPSFLQIVDKPLPKKQPAQEAAAHPAKAPAATAAPKKPAGMSPLELARQQGAAKSSETAAKSAASPAGEGKKLSPLELARQQGAAKPTAGATAAPKAAPNAEPGRKLSPLELARQQGAAKREGAPSTPKAEATEPQPPPSEPESPPAAPKTEPPTPVPQNTAGLSKIELARLQGPAKR